jgi:hypothetical protein
MQLADLAHSYGKSKGVRSAREALEMHALLARSGRLLS